MLAACEQESPTAPAAESRGFNLTASAAGTASCLALPNSGLRTATFTVTLSDRKTPARGTLVSAVDPTAPNRRCWGVTNDAGVIAFENLPNAGRMFFTFRDEMAYDGARLEIFPPSPLTTLWLADDPSNPLVRHAPALVGGSKCSVTGFSWARMKEIVQTGCDLTKLSKMTVTLPATTRILKPKFYDLNGDEIPNVVISALTPRIATFDGVNMPTQLELETACAEFGYIDYNECVGNSHGPAFAHAMDVTGTDAGILGLDDGLAVPAGERVLLEVVGLQNQNTGLTLFGTLVVPADASQASDATLYPGVCNVQHEPDPTDNVGLDLRGANFGTGLALGYAPEGQLERAVLSATPTNLIVVAKIFANESGTAEITFEYQPEGSSLWRAIKATARIAPTSCEVLADSWTGSGLTWSDAGGNLKTVGKGGYCQQDAETGVYSVVFQVQNLPDMNDAVWSLKTNAVPTDNMPEPQRSMNIRGGIRFDFLNVPTCPIPSNTDGRLIGIG